MRWKSSSPTWRDWRTMKLVIKVSEDEAQELMLEIRNLQRLIEEMETLLQEVRQMLANDSPL